jgi:hypothetical protein
MPSFAQAEAEEGVAAVATGIASCAATDLSVGDLAADIVLRPVGVQRYFGAIEHYQQFAPVGMEPCQQAIECDEAGLAREDAVVAARTADRGDDDPLSVRSVSPHMQKTLLSALRRPLRSIRFFSSN